MIPGAESMGPELVTTVHALRTAYRDSPDSAFVLDTEGRFLMVNPTLCRFLRVAEDDLLGQTHDRFSQSTDAETIRRQLATVLGGTATRYRATGARLSGEHFLTEVTLLPLRIDEQVVAVLGTAQDLTLTAQAEADARRSADLLRLAGRIARFGGWSVDAASGMVDLSEGARQMLGIPDDVDDLAAAVRARLTADGLPRLSALLERCVTTGEPFELESLVVPTGGEQLTIRTVGEAERRADGTIVGARGAILDVTAAASARERLAYQAALLDSARDVMLVRDLDGTIRYWNRAAAELYGWSAEEAVGRNAFELIGMDPDVRAVAIGELMRTGYFAGELEQRTRDGRTIVIDARWQLIVNAEGVATGIFAVNTDITEYRRELEARQRAQRLESLGTLAGGIAHDLNNVLTPILMSVQLLAQDEQDPERLELLSTMETAVKRGSEMIRQVLSFARGVDGRRERVDVDRLLNDLLLLTRDVVPPGVEVVVHRAPVLPAVIGDPTQLLQVLVNLVTNARDALGGSGRLSIRAEALEIADEYTSVSHAAVQGSYLQIAVEDTGHGMSAEIVSKIFEPFFTTKPQSRGTGLGLATSLAIIRSHGGFMQVYSEPDLGTRFTIGLPAAPQEVETAPLAFSTSELPRGAGDVVLVVDDDEAIRSVTRRTLEAHGYRVLVAGDGREAIELIEHGDTAVDIVLTDMMMPVMDGAATSAYLEEHHPGVPIIAASGLNSGDDSKAVGMGIARFIAKPYTTEALLTSVSDTLREHRLLPEGKA